MDLPEIEDKLLRGLDSPRIDSGTHREALRTASAVDLVDIAGVGLDTNILKQLRRQPLKAERLSLTLQQYEVQLIVPAQSVVEFWNNHHIFASEDWNQIGTSFAQLRKRLSSVGLDDDTEQRLETIQASVDDIAKDLEDSKSPDFLQKSYDLLESLLSLAIVPRVSRTSFYAVGMVRLQSKQPPGFADEERKKKAPLGDFFAWCDFLLGTMHVLQMKEQESGFFVWVTDDAKPDWKTGGQGHPSLIEESRLVSGADIAIFDWRRLEGLLDAAEAASARPKDDSD